MPSALRLDAAKRWCQRTLVLRRRTHSCNRLGVRNAHLAHALVDLFDARFTLLPRGLSILIRPLCLGFRLCDEHAALGVDARDLRLCLGRVRLGHCLGPGELLPQLSCTRLCCGLCLDARMGCCLSRRFGYRRRKPSLPLLGDCCQTRRRRRLCGCLCSGALLTALQFGGERLSQCCRTFTLGLQQLRELLREGGEVLGRVGLRQGGQRGGWRDQQCRVGRRRCTR
mmetsp:Transcript_2270/g.6434  ORF Transcript_2270/g.6434 Transcript_2270/m.6434 type:complete len:226 (-) Transcript_2270:1069-1746(-)